MRSMTGFGRALVKRGERSIQLEIKTVNHRFLDISIKQPKGFSFLEEQIRKEVGKRLLRGHADIYITYQREGAAAVQLDEGLLKAYIASLQAASDRFGLKKIKKTSEIVGLPDIFIKNEAQEDEALLSDMLKEALSQALAKLVLMRETEGENLRADLALRLLEIEKATEEIERIAQNMPQKLYEKLRERLSAYPLKEIDENRLYQELAIISDKCVVDEELTRLKSHILQMREIFVKQGEKGRRMDFLVQEMHREVNTIASKAQDKTIVSLTVDMKCDIEKMREQIQNVE